MTKLKIKKDDEEITLLDEKDIQDKLDEKANNADMDDKTTTATVTYADGSTGTINFVTR